MKIVVWFSCGIPSAVAAKKTIELFGEDNEVIVLNNPVIEEHEDNLRFKRDVEGWIGQPIIDCVNPKFINASAEEVWEKRQYMGGIKGAPCTYELKKAARYNWVDKNKPDFHVFGYTDEEWSRHKDFVTSELSQVLPILIVNRLTREDCTKIIQDAGIAIPEMYKLGYPNNNCIGCIKSTSPTYWNHVRKTHPEIFEKRSIQSRNIGTKLVRVKGERIFLDELDPNARGRKLNSLSFDCGPFCEPEKINL